MTVSQRLNEEIAIQQGEVARLKQVAEVDYPKAVATLEGLKALAKEITPEFERLAAKLETVKIVPRINVDTEIEKEKPPK